MLGRTLTLKGSILGMGIFLFCAALLGFFKMYQISSAYRKSHPGTTGQVGFDLVTMWHNAAIYRDPFFWIVLIVFAWIGSFILHR